MPIIYRYADKKDIKEINNLFIELVLTVNKKMIKEGIEPYKELEKGLDDNYWNEFFTKEDRKILVAEDNGNVIGFLSLCINKEYKYLYLDDYCINEKYRGKGIGSKLMDMAVDYAKKNKINNIGTHVESANHEAREFYKKKGFKLYKEEGYRLLINKSLMNFTLAEAIEYSKEGRTEEWVQEFLRNKEEQYANPNFVLADGLLLEERFYYGPIEVKLDDITTMRVEKDLKGAELESYNRRVDRMSSDFNGTNFPPLILEYRDNKLYLTDGSHRYSTLKRKDVDKYYAIIWGNKNLENDIHKKYAIIKTRR